MHGPPVRPAGSPSRGPGSRSASGVALLAAGVPQVLLLDDLLAALHRAQRLVRTGDDPVPGAESGLHFDEPVVPDARLEGSEKGPSILEKIDPVDAFVLGLVFVFLARDRRLG